MDDSQRKYITHIKDTPVAYYEYKEYGIQGVGRNHIPIVNMDLYIGHDMDDELHIEVCKGLVLAKKFHAGIFNSAIPPEIQTQYKSDIYTKLINELDSREDGAVHRTALEDIVGQYDGIEGVHAIARYGYYALGAVIPWYFTIQLKESTFATKTNPSNPYTEDSKHFPKLLRYVDTLPFKHVGRIIIFTTFPNAGVITHRDGEGIVKKHRDHSINLFFSGSRPTFIYDEIKKEKVYLEKGAKSYFFNNRDYHGVDPEPVFRYTVRVDGTFNDDMIDILQLENGYV